MLAEHLAHLEERLYHRLAGALQDVQAPPASSAPLLTPGELAERLRVSVRTVQRMVVEGEFPPPIQLRSKWLEARAKAGELAR